MSTTRVLQNLFPFRRTLNHPLLGFHKHLFMKYLLSLLNRAWVRSIKWLSRTTFVFYHSLGRFCSSQNGSIFFPENRQCWRQFAWNVKAYFLGKWAKHFKISSNENFPSMLTIEELITTVADDILIFFFVTFKYKTWNFMQIIHQKENKACHFMWIIC